MGLARCATRYRAPVPAAHPEAAKDDRDETNTLRLLYSWRYLDVDITIADAIRDRGERRALRQ